MSNKIKKIIFKNKEVSLLVSLVLLSVFFTILSYQSNREEEKKPRTPGAEKYHVDTLIPKGHSLVPIEIANYETLDSILGPYGIVDIYTTPLNPKETAKRIAYRVKIVRAPKNPSHFAILVPFEKVKYILKYSGPYTVSIQNPKAGGTVFEKEKSRKTRVTYFPGE